MLQPLRIAHGFHLSLLLVVLAVAGCGESRETRSEPDLLDLRRKSDDTALKTSQSAFDRIVEAAKAQHDDHVAGRRSSAPTIDVLIISGGGDWGAFGAGFLKGWGKIPPTDPLARPQFNAVTGVSTGALIAPFAYLGDEQSINQIDHLYRNPKSDWVQTRGMLYFLPSHISFASIPGLERELRKTVEPEMIKKIAATAGDGRLLAVSTTNLDDGGTRVFNLVEESQRAMATGDLDRIQNILLASAGIPGVFPFRMIDDEMLVDGGITGNIIYGGRVSEEESLPAVWQKKYPGVPIPKIRYWVIFNNQLRTGPKTTEPRWPAVVSRSLELSVRFATITALRHLTELSRNAKLHRGADVEVRIVAIPNDWKAKTAGVFLKETMNDLADVGQKMGADPKSWMTELP